MSEPVRTITFTASASGVTPSYPQAAGVQGDHNATKVVFQLDSSIIKSTYKYRFEYVDGGGGWDTTDYITPVDNSLSILLPEAWTAAGGCGTIRLQVSELGADNVEELIVYTLTGRLLFADRDSGEPMETAYEKGLSGLIQDAHDAIDRAKAATVRVGTVSTGEPGADAAVSNSGTDTDAVLDFVLPRGETGPQGIQGPKGEKGDDGTGVTILGSYDTAEQLKADHPTGSVGDSYLVNSDLYVWSENVHDWVNTGSIKGPKGEDGVLTVTDLSPGLFGLYVNEEGHLILIHNDNEPAPPLSIQDGRLIYTIS